MYRPGGMSSDESDWDDDYFSQNAYSGGEVAPALCQVSLEDQFLISVNEKDIGKVKEFISQGIDINFMPCNNWNAIIRASSYGCFELVKLLVENGADVNSSHEKFTPILAVCSSSSRDEDQLETCLKFLISKGAKISVFDWYRISPLSHAVKHNHVKLVKLLISEKADLNGSDQDGWSPIFYAVDGGNCELVILLKDAGSNVYGFDKRGRALVDIALEKDYFDIVKILSCVSNTDEWFVYKCESIRNVYEKILSQFPLKPNRLSGFDHDVFTILYAVQLGHLNRFFLKHKVGLGDLLCCNENYLKKIGIQFWFERMKIIRMVEKFHESPWHLNSFGSVVSQPDFDLFQIGQLMTTIVRQMYIISVTSYRFKKHVGLLPELKPLPYNIRDSLQTVLSIRRKLISVQHLTKKIDEELSLIPSDLILPLRNSSYFNFQNIILASCLAAMLVYKSNIISKIYLSCLTR